MKQSTSIDPSLSPEGIRRKLEGRLEVVEDAFRSMALLGKLLRKRRWEHRLYPHLELLSQVIAQEPALGEALAGIRQRARLEHWPKTLPALRLAGEVEELKERLVQRARACLGDASTSRESLAELLRRLEERARTVVLPLSSPDEPVLLKDGFSPRVFLPAVLSMGLPLAPVPFIGVLPSLGDFALAGIYGGAIGLWLLFSSWWLRRQSHRSGRLWVTREQLIWVPSQGDPRRVPLRSLVPGGARVVSPHRAVVEVEGGPPLELAFMGNVSKLVTVLNFINTWTDASDSLLTVIQKLDEKEARRDRRHRVR
jgi:hypothetical protein